MTVIHKSPEDWRVTPNLVDYENTCTTFRWDAAPDVCAGMGDGLCNIAYAAVDRHAGGSAGGRTALRFVSESALTGETSVRDLEYSELASLSSRFTAVLRALGVGKGDRVFTLLGRCPELYVTILGALRNGSVVSPLFSAFGPEPVATRLRLGDAHVLVTTRAMYRKKVADSRSALTSLKHVLLIDEDIDDDIGEEEGATATGFWRWMEATPDGAPIEPTTADDPALLLLRDQVDLDSMDWLNFLVGIHKRLHVDIPEADYRKLRTLADVVGYVGSREAPS